MPAHRGEDIAAISEYLAEAYLRLAEASREEPVLSAALELAGVAVYRLGTLHPELAGRAPLESTIRDNSVIQQGEDAARTAPRR